MRFRILILATFLGTVGVPLSWAQSSDSDPQAVAVLQQALNASGTPLHPFRSFTASGTMTYYWASQPVQGAATIRARGKDQFRLDVALPDGFRSLATTAAGGKRKNPDGKLTAIPLHNTLSSAIVTIPYPGLAAALADSSVAVSYVALVNAGDRQWHQIRLTRRFSEQSDPDGILAQLSTIEYFIDARTYLVAKTADLTHPKETLTESYPHEVEFEAYTAMQGIAVPTLVREKVAGQTTWELGLSSINFNTDLTDADFLLP